MAAKALTTGFDWSAPPEKPSSPPDTLEAIITAVDDANKRTIGLVESTPDAQLTETVKFFTGPKRSVTFRKSTSCGSSCAIYGPSGDEPWF